jgi:hypothetical protein
LFRALREVLMEFTEMITALGLTERAVMLRPGWEDSLRSLPPGEIDFLTEPFVRRASEYFAAAPEGVEAAVAAAGRIAADPALRAFAWHYHCAVYGREQGDWEQIRHWPVPEAALGADAKLFCTLVLLSGLRRMESEHRAHHIPEEVVRATLADVRAGLHRRREDDSWGISPHDVGWFSNFLRGDLYRLERLQFQFGSFGYRLRAFRHFETGAVLALSEAGMRYGPDGQVQRSDDQEGAWTATLEVNGGRAVGYPVVPEGRALRTEVTLPQSEWKQVLAPRDPVLYIHIPGSGRQPMDYDRCGDSLRQASEFFPRHYPDYRFHAFCCESWILNTWLQRVLPPTSNMRRFQQEVYLFPVAMSAEETVRTAFGWKLPEDWGQAPRDTSLRRAIAAAMETGEEIEVAGGGCFLLREDLRWGEQVYRQQVLPVAV